MTTSQADLFLQTNKTKPEPGKWIHANGWGMIRSDILEEGLKRKALVWKRGILCITAREKMVATDSKGKALKDPYKTTNVSEEYFFFEF